MCGLRNVIRHGEAASTDKKETDRFKEEVNNFIDVNEFLLQQIFIFDETGLFYIKIYQTVSSTPQAYKRQATTPPWC